MKSDKIKLRAPEIAGDPEEDRLAFSAFYVARFPAIPVAGERPSKRGRMAVRS